MTEKKRKTVRRTALTDPRNIGIVWDDAKTAEALSPAKKAAPKKAKRTS